MDATRARSRKPWFNVLVVAAALAVGLVALQIRPRAATAARVTDGERTLTVPKLASPPKLDGELDDAVWQGSIARTGPLLAASGAAARPYSDARIGWTDQDLVLAFYAADDDVRSVGARRDSIKVTLGRDPFDVGATGELRGAPAGTRVGHDLDGTLDDPSDDDEEWVLELAVPLASLGLAGRDGETLPLSIERCETTRDGVHACSAVHAALALRR